MNYDIISKITGKIIKEIKRQKKVYRNNERISKKEILFYIMSKEEDKK